MTITMSSNCFLLRRSAIPMRSSPSPFQGCFLSEAGSHPTSCNCVYVTCFLLKNMPYKHFILDIQALGCWKGCLAFGWRSQFWVEVANFLGVMRDERQVGTTGDHHECDERSAHHEEQRATRDGGRP